VLDRGRIAGERLICESNGAEVVCMMMVRLLDDL